MANIVVNLKDDELEILKEFRNPAMWPNWKKLNKKCRYVLQRMIVNLPGGKKYVMEIAKEASHNLGHCKWCTHDATIYQMAKDIFK